MIWQRSEKQLVTQSTFVSITAVKPLKQSTQLFTIQILIKILILLVFRWRDKTCVVLEIKSNSGNLFMTSLIHASNASVSRWITCINTFTLTALVSIHFCWVCFIYKISPLTFPLQSVAVTCCCVYFLDIYKAKKSWNDLFSVAQHLWAIDQSTSPCSDLDECILMRNNSFFLKMIVMIGYSAVAFRCLCITWRGYLHDCELRCLAIGELKYILHWSVQLRSNPSTLNLSRKKELESLAFQAFCI